MSENAYKRWFRQQCAEDGLNLGVADTLRRLRHAASPAGYKRMIGNTIRNNQRHAEVMAQRRAEQGETGRAA